MTSFLLDLRFALRSFARRPTFTTATVLSLALAIAANAAVFSVVNAALFKGVPGVTRPEHLVEISRDVAGTATDVTFPMYRQLRAQSAVLDDLAALSLGTVSIRAGDAPAVRGALAVTSSYFALLGVRPQRGRVFSPREAEYPQVEPVALITDEVWQRDFGGASDIVGRVVRVNGVPVQVIGVLPRGFAGHHTGLLVDVYLPLGAPIPGLPVASTLSAGTGSSVELLGRLPAGVTPSSARAALSLAANAFAQEIGESTPARPYRVRVDTWGPLPAVVRGPVSIFLGALGLLVTLALAMAGTNVTTILLARASERRRELAVRRSLGATERRLVRQLVTEVVVLFAAGGIAGVVLARWMTSLVTGIQPPLALPGRLGADFGFDWRVLGYSLLVTLGAALVFSLLPSMTSSRFDVAAALREGSASETRGRVRLRTALVGVQVAVTTVLLGGTLLFGHALSAMRELSPGWNADDVLVTSLNLQLNGTAREAGLVFQRRLLERVRATPGVESAALSTKLQLGGRSSFGLATAPGARIPAGMPGIDAALNRVSGGYLASLRIPLLAGRDIAPTDIAGAPLVAVVNETMARRLFPGVDPVSRTFDVLAEERRTFRVIGVAADAELRSPGQPPVNFYYVPLAQWYNPEVNLVVRAAAGSEAAITPAIARAIDETDPSLPHAGVRALAEALQVFLLPQRLAAWVAGVTGIFGLLLAAVGIYGVTAFLVMRRSREVAIRLALGATNGHVARLLLRRGSLAPAIGVIIGSLIAAALTVGASGVLVGARAGDPLVLIGAPLTIALVTLLAMLLPVRRLLAGSPMARLRED